VIRTAVCSSMGMLTRPNAIEPFQSARAMVTSVSTLSRLRASRRSPGRSPPPRSR
jgi:hypothetical protein